MTVFLRVVLTACLVVQPYCKIVWDVTQYENSTLSLALYAAVHVQNHNSVIYGQDREKYHAHRFLW